MRQIQDRSDYLRKPWTGALNQLEMKRAELKQLTAQIILEISNEKLRLKEPSVSQIRTKQRLSDLSDNLFKVNRKIADLDRAEYFVRKRLENALIETSASQQFSNSS